jgi:hypothetical protein
LPETHPATNRRPFFGAIQKTGVTGARLYADQVILDRMHESVESDAEELELRHYALTDKPGERLLRRFIRLNNRKISSSLFRK